MTEIAKILSAILAEKNIRLVTAESCTGGMIAAAITDLPGSSSVFERGFVTYSNESKQELLSVSKEIIEQFGAVSAQCAQAMAQGALRNSLANLAVSVTGIAGPDGGSCEKPVGLVYIGIATADEVIVTKCNFTGTRADIRASTCTKAFDLLTQTARAI